MQRGMQAMHSQAGQGRQLCMKQAVLHGKTP